MTSRKNADGFSRWHPLVCKAYKVGVMILVASGYSIEVRREGDSLRGSFSVDGKELDWFIFKSSESLANYLSQSYNLDAFGNVTFSPLEEKVTSHSHSKP